MHANPNRPLPRPRPEPTPVKSIMVTPDGRKLWPPETHDFYSHETVKWHPDDVSFNLAEKIMAFESSELEDTEIFELFQYLIDTGHAWTLQGSYGRTAEMLIEGGQCHVKEAEA